MALLLLLLLLFCQVKDTEDEGDQRADGERHPHVGHQVIERRDGDTVRQHALQTHEHHARGKRHARTHVVQSLSVVHLHRQPIRLFVPQKRGETGHDYEQEG